MESRGTTRRRVILADTGRAPAFLPFISCFVLWDFLFRGFGGVFFPSVFLGKGVGEGVTMRLFSRRLTGRTGPDWTGIFFFFGRGVFWGACVLYCLYVYLGSSFHFVFVSFVLFLSFVIGEEGV